MQLNPAEQRDAVKWFWGSLIFAIALSFFVQRFDWYKLTNTKEEEHNAALQELRNAQSSLPVSALDDRTVIEPAVATRATR